MVSERLTTHLIDPFNGNTYKIRRSFEMNLVNPFSGKKIKLPQIVMDCDTFIYTIILSHDPSLNPDNYILAAICKYERTVAFMRSGDESWTCFDREKLCSLHAIMFYKGQLYATDAQNGLTKVNFNKNTSSDHDLEILMPKRDNPCDFMSYLVESVDEELLLIKRFYSDNAREAGKFYTNMFHVFKLVMGKEQVNKSLRNQTLFVGHKFSMSVLLADDDFCRHMKRNSIYYTDDSIHDVTVEGQNIKFDDIYGDF